MIIDCHGHYTTEPPALHAYRRAQLTALEDRSATEPDPPVISDEELRASVEDHQLRVLRARGGDLMLLSPRASGMGHHVTDPGTASRWAQTSNDLIARLTRLYPDHFAGVCQLPQTPGGSLEAAVTELRRCVETLGFVGVNLNPDPSGGFWTSPALTDDHWFPLYEAMTDLDVPAMVHVSASCNPVFHALGAHYLNADTSAFMQFLEGDLFTRFPTLRFVIPHGGGAVPYHWGRYRGLAERMGWAEPSTLWDNVFFDTCVYHQPGIDLLTHVIPTGNVLFASEMLGAVRGSDPQTGVEWDDTKSYVDRTGLTEQELSQVYEGNARRVYPRLDAQLTAAGR
ncbi:MAG: 4-oxalomesaconate hydratase [Klenkia sp.]|nr:4-oxalomesaconate hydratase [Klenkia sp.]